MIHHHRSPPVFQLHLPTWTQESVLHYRILLLVCLLHAFCGRINGTHTTSQSSHLHTTSQSNCPKSFAAHSEACQCLHHFHALICQQLSHCPCFSYPGSPLSMVSHSWMSVSFTKEVALLQMNVPISNHGFIPSCSLSNILFLCTGCWLKFSTFL